MRAVCSLSGAPPPIESKAELQEALVVDRLRGSLLDRRDGLVAALDEFDDALLVAVGKQHVVELIALRDEEVGGAEADSETGQQQCRRDDFG